MNDALIKKTLDIFRCPACFSGNLETRGALRGKSILCPGCGAVYPVKNGIVDFYPDSLPSSNIVQKFMENRWVARVYENHFRPAFTRIGSSATYRDEELFLERYDAPDNHRWILDIAAGTGRYARYFSERNGKGTVIALDISLPMLEIGKASAEKAGCANILFVKGDAGNLPIKDHVMDRVNCFGALHLFPDPWRSLDEMSRIGVDGCPLTVLTACRVERPVLAKIQKILTAFSGFRFFNPDELEVYFKDHGLQNVFIRIINMLIMFGGVIQRSEEGLFRVDDNRRI
jgi:SAM-dependent methyltransferase/uncharacterized protein YbaR (Trm112 family)